MTNKYVTLRKICQHHVKPAGLWRIFVKQNLFVSRGPFVIQEGQPLPPRMSSHRGPCSLLSHLSHVQLFATLWTVACQAHLSVGILQARMLEWDLPNPGIKITSHVYLQGQASFLPLSSPGKPHGDPDFSVALT